MIEKNKKRNTLAMIGLFIISLVVIGVSYAVWQLTLVQTEKNIVMTGCFKVEFTDQNPITIDKAYPITDEEGKSNTPYEFTLTNTCDGEATYYINLETITAVEKKLSEQYVKASLKKGEEEVFFNNLNSSYINLDKVISKATNAYKLYEGVLKAKEETTFSLNLWMSEDTPSIDEVMNATYEGKITVLTSYKAPPEKNLMIAMDMVSGWDGHGGDYWQTFSNTVYRYGDKLSKVIFQDVIQPYENATVVDDLSEAQDRSVLGYYVKNDEDENYILYIQADGKIKVNPKASYYFFNYAIESQPYGSFEGFENLDTSLVTDMSNMFYKNGNETLDLRSFDTTNVTNMSHMFDEANAVGLDLSSFNTSNVTDMSNMFYNMYNLKSLDLSNFDTSNVTNMHYMFRDNVALTDLNVTSFNTSKVVDMGAMFLQCYNLTTLDLSSFDTSNVIIYNDDYGHGLFSSDSKLTTIIYGANFIKKEGASIGNMFSNCPANRPTHESWNGVAFE